MPPLTSLLDDFHTMSLADDDTPTNYHELCIEYPCLDLLPVEETVVPSLSPPRCSGFRDKPDASRFHLKTCGVEFSSRMSLDRPIQSSHQSPEVLTAIHGLSFSPGQSLLQIASYTDEDGLSIYFRFRLLTRNCTGQYETVAESEVSDVEWASESEGLKTEVWFQLVEDLLHRASDRAYFYVHERLKAFRWYQKQQEKEVWAWEDPVDAREILAFNIRVVTGNRWGELHTQRVYDHDFQGDGEGTFMMPCGHALDLRIEDLRAITVAECISFSYATWGAKVMADEDLWLLCHHRERERKTDFLKQEYFWQKLDQTSPLSPYQKISVHPSHLITAIKHARKSLRVPESASPGKLNMAASNEIESALTAFWPQLNRSKGMVTCAPAGIISELMQHFDQALQKDRDSTISSNLPPGWLPMVRLWMTRAVQLAGIPGYDGRSISATFGEEVVEDKEVELGKTTIDDLEAMMKGANLG